MGNPLENKLVVVISSHVLFDTRPEREEQEIPGPGPGFELVRELLNMNRMDRKKKRVEVILLSHHSPDTALCMFSAISAYGLEISRAVLTSGASVASYLDAFHPDLFLSTHEEDVQYAIDAGMAAGVIGPDGGSRRLPREVSGQIKIAFDGDAVLFTEESEKIFREKGLEAFEKNEVENVEVPLQEGPFAKLLKKIWQIQKEFSSGTSPIRTALVTARCAPAHERVLRTLGAWNVRIDEVFFLGGIPKKEVLQAFGAHIFFDDQQIHTAAAGQVVAAARVPWRRQAV